MAKAVRINSTRTLENEMFIVTNGRFNKEKGDRNPAGELCGVLTSPLPAQPCGNLEDGSFYPWCGFLRPDGAKQTPYQR